MLLKKAEGLYQGSFLEELYEGWCIEERERYKQMYLSTVKSIIGFYENRKDYQACIRYAGKYLNIDRYSETVTRMLMKYYALSGNRPMVKRVYVKFKTMVMEDLECTLSDETDSLYRSLAAV